MLKYLDLLAWPRATFGGRKLYHVNLIRLAVAKIKELHNSEGIAAGSKAGLLCKEICRESLHGSKLP